MSQQEFTRKSQVMQHMLEEVAEEFSRETGFVQRRSKMNGKVFAQTMIMGWLDNPEATLNELVQGSRQLGVEISESGLQQRINAPAVEFLKRLFVHSVRTFREGERLPEEVLSPFSQVNILDSSIVTLPESLQDVYAGYGVKGGEAALKVQLSFDYLTGDLNAVELVAGREPDQNCTLHTTCAGANSLQLFDLGYFKQGVFANLAQAGAYFISRLQTQTALYHQADDKHALDLMEWLQSQPPALGEGQVYLGYKERLPVRLVFQPLPPDVVEERRRKAKAKARKSGKTCTRRHLALLAWSLFITNVPASWLSVAQVLLVYRVRWQVELIFKVWKSQAKLNKIGAWCQERVLCQLYGRLLALVLFHWTIAPLRFYQHYELSPVKAFRVLQRYALRFLDAMAQDWHLVALLLKQLAEDFRRFALKNLRQSSCSTFQLLVLVGA